MKPSLNWISLIGLTAVKALVRELCGVHQDSTDQRDAPTRLRGFGLAHGFQRQPPVQGKLLVPASWGSFFREMGVTGKRPSCGERAS